MSELDSPSEKFERTEADALAELQADKVAADGKWEDFGAPAEVTAEAKEQWKVGLLSSVEEGVDLNLSQSEGATIPTPENVVAQKQELGDRIIALSGGGKVQPNKVTLARLRLADGSELHASRDLTGRVLGIGVTELTSERKEINSEIDFADLGVPREYASRYTLDTDGQTKKLEATIITTTGESKGNISGEASQWSSDRSGESQNIELTEQQAGAMIQATLDLISQKTEEAERPAQAA